MEFGFKLPNLSPLYGRDPIMEVARNAERLGFEFLWASDHVLFPGDEEVRDKPGPRSFPVTYRQNASDPLIALAFAAAVTERVKLGTSVLVLPLRNPIVTAKQIASLDMLSGGRVSVAVGAGWQEKEFAALGASHRDRGRVTEEWVEILRRCWRDERPSYRGEFYNFDPIHFYPKPAHPIEILMGVRTPEGWRRLARCGDGYHGTGLTIEEARDAAQSIARAAQEVGRQGAEFRMTTLCDMRVLDRADPPEAGGRRTLVGTPEEIAGYVRALEALGFSHIGMRLQHVSGSTIPGREVEPDLERALEQLQRFHHEVLPLL